MVQLFLFLGGISLFLYGMQMMGDGLQQAAGARLQKILGQLTKKTIYGVALGAGVTAVLQSSSATTVMTVGLVNAGLMNLEQAFGIVMGANIGTTMTAQLIAFNLTDYITLIIAIGLWVYVVSTVTPDDSQWVYRIPVTFTNEDGLFSDRNLVLASGRDATVNLRFNGKRRDLLKLNNTNVTVTADLSQVTGAGDWRLPYTVELPETVSSSGIEVEERSSSFISINVDKLLTRSVEIRAVFQGDVAEGYTPEAIELEYDSMDISGPRELVDRVSYAQVVLERTNVSRTISENLSFALMDEDGVQIESDDLRCTVNGTAVDKIGVLMPVNMIKEVPLRVELIEGGGATADHATVSYDPAQITIKGDPEVLAGLNSIYLGTVDLSGIQNSVTEEFSIVIADGLTNMTGTQAKVTVELRNLKTKTFQVSNIELTNAPENLQARLGTLSLEVQLRGTAEAIDALAASGIRAVADLSGILATGTFSVPVEIYVDASSEVGAMGSYSVLVTIAEPTTETAVEVTGVSEQPAASAVPTAEPAAEQEAEPAAEVTEQDTESPQ